MRAWSAILALLLPAVALADVAPSPDCDCAVSDPVLGSLALAAAAAVAIWRRR